MLLMIKAFFNHFSQSLVYGFQNEFFAIFPVCLFDSNFDWFAPKSLNIFFLIDNVSPMRQPNFAKKWVT